MYIKFLAHGKGDPSKASSYLIDEVDHLNRPRPDIQVLRGDPQTFTALAQSIQMIGSIQAVLLLGQSQTIQQMQKLVKY